MAEEPKKKELLKISETGSEENSTVPTAVPTIEGYKILNKMGEGGMGSVWRAMQLSTHREVALKVMTSDIFSSDKARLRFEREVELAAQLEHPNLARIYESGLHKGKYYYTMELIQGEHLDQYVQNKELSKRQILELIHSVCQAVQYAHQRGVIHRDLKPSNILVTDDGQPHVLDFGLAKMLLDDDREDGRKWEVSENGDIFGTPAYMSPEQAAGHLDKVDTRTDVYSLGIILFNLLTNDWPYDLSGSRYEVLRNIQEEGPIRPSKIISHFDSEIEAILLKALDKDPNRRYQSVAELGNDINAWLKGLPISARSVDLFYLLRKFMLRYRAASIIVGLLFVIIVSTAFISLYSYSQARSALSKSQAYQEQYKRTAERNLSFANQVLLNLFLELWHDNKSKRAETIAMNFATESRERMAAQFLLDLRPLSQKEPDFQKNFLPGQASFWHFVLGEYYHKIGNNKTAAENYRLCLEKGKNSSDLDDWFKNRAKRMLEELTHENAPAQ